MFGDRCRPVAETVCRYWSLVTVVGRDVIGVGHDVGRVDRRVDRVDQSFAER